MSLVELHQISKAYGNVKALDCVSVSLVAGEAVQLIGPNGAGKSTLLRVIAGIERVDSGSVVVGGYDLARREAYYRFRKSFRLGVVGQKSFLYDDLTVSENLELFSKLAGNSGALTVTNLVEMFSLGPSTGQMVRYCSQGVRQKTAVARALVNDPELLLLDEPYSNVDAQGRNTMQGYLESAQRAGVTILMVSHDHAVSTCPLRTIAIANGRVENCSSARAY